MLNRLASLAMSTRVLKALPGKLDIKIHSPSILYIHDRIDNINSYYRILINIYNQEASEYDNVMSQSHSTDRFMVN